MDRLVRATVVKLNSDEAVAVAAMAGLEVEPLDAFCAGLAERAGLRGVCVSRGADAFVLWLDGASAAARAYRAVVVDTVGGRRVQRDARPRHRQRPRTRRHPGPRGPGRRPGPGRAGGTRLWDLAEALALEPV